MAVGTALGIVVIAIVFAALPLLLQNGLRAFWATLILTIGGLVLYAAFEFTGMPLLVIISVALIVLLGWITSQLQAGTNLTVEESGAVSVTVVFAALMGGAFTEEVAQKGSLSADWRYLVIGASALFIMATMTAIRVWRRTAPDEPADKPPVEAAPSEQPAPEPAPEPAPTDPGEPFLRDVLAAKQWADSEVEKAVRAHERDLETEYSEDMKLKDRLAAFATEQKLDQALIDLWQELKYYPTLDPRAEIDSTRLKVSNVKGSRVNDLESITFSYQGHRYTITARDWGGTGEVYRDFALHEDGNEVFAINCSLDKVGNPPRYAAYDVKAFKTRGHWARTLLDLHRHLRIQHDIRAAESRYYGADNIKGRFEE